MIFNMVGGGAGGGAVLNVLRVPTLPGTVINGQVVVVSDVPALKFSFGYALPTSPAAGDIWVHVVDSGTYPVELDDGLSHVTLTLGAAMQYVSGAWVYRDAYVGVGGVWQMCSTLSPLSTLSWTAIGAIAASGEDVTRFFAVGDKKLVELTTTVLSTSSFQVEILDFLHDDLSTGSGKAPITFGMVDCFAETQAMNSSGSAGGGWPAMSMRATLQNTVYPAFPADLQSVIKPVTKLSNNQSQAQGTLVAVNDPLWLLAEVEIFGSYPNSYAGEGSKYARFVNTADRIKRISGGAVTWYTRSPGNGIPSYTVDSWCYVTAAGAAADGLFSSASYAHGVACAFCV